MEGQGGRESGNSENGASSGGEEEYEFTGGETQLLRICMDAMHTAGLALIVQGIATGLLGAQLLSFPQTPCQSAGVFLTRSLTRCQLQVTATLLSLKNECCGAQSVHPLQHPSSQCFSQCFLAPIMTFSWAKRGP